MNTTRFALLVAFVSAAGLAAAQELVPVEKNTFDIRAGVAMRSRMKASASSSVKASSVTTVDKDANKTTWTVADVEEMQDPDYPNDPTFTLWGFAVNTDTTTVTPTANHRSDKDSGVGGKVDVFVSLYDTDSLSFGLTGMFAGYGNMKAKLGPIGGVQTVSRTTDIYLFRGAPIPPDDDFSYCTPTKDPTNPAATSSETTTVLPGSSLSGASITADLFQLGIGPEVRVSLCKSLDFYANALVLANFAHAKYEATGFSESENKCLVGGSFNAGLEYRITDCIGIYGQVGYETIDSLHVKAGVVDAKVDLSSFTGSLGLSVAF